MAKSAYIVKLNGKLEAARITTIKDRNGNESFQATVTDAEGNVIGTGFGDSTYEACDNVR